LRFHLARPDIFQKKKKNEILTKEGPSRPTTIGPLKLLSCPSCSCEYTIWEHSLPVLSLRRKRNPLRSKSDAGARRGTASLLRQPILLQSRFPSASPHSPFVAERISSRGHASVLGLLEARRRWRSEAARGLGSAGRFHSGGSPRARGGGRSRSRAVPSCPAPPAASFASPAQRRVPGEPEGAGDARGWGARKAGARRSNRGIVVVGGANGTAKLLVPHRYFATISTGI
jgi:hypothetical protein